MQGTEVFNMTGVRCICICRCRHVCECTNCRCMCNAPQNMHPRLQARVSAITTPAPPLQTSCSNMSKADLDNTCRASEAQYKRFDNGATILPGIGLPSQNNGVCTILHGMGEGAHNLHIQGLESKSPLANAALYSSECSGGQFLNLYEMMLPEGISKTPGGKSNAELYAQELNANNVNTAGQHWHWWASDPYVAAIHHQNVGMNPTNFSNTTVNALTNYRQRMESGQYKS